jgi:hypothetical protein
MFNCVGYASHELALAACRKLYTSHRGGGSNWSRTDLVIVHKNTSELTEVAVRLLACHATSAATERKWSLWGRVYTAAKSRLGLEHAKEMITICANEKARVPHREACATTLDMIEDTEEA